MTDEVKKGRAVTRMAIILWRIAMVRPGSKPLLNLLCLFLGIVLGVLGFFYVSVLMLESYSRATANETFKIYAAPSQKIDRRDPIQQLREIPRAKDKDAAAQTKEYKLP